MVKEANPKRGLGAKGIGACSRLLEELGFCYLETFMAASLLFSININSVKTEYSCEFSIHL
jgi:hypothetical protein